MKKELPLPVLYASGESRFVETSEPVAIILQSDSIALFVRNFPKMSYTEARNRCDEMMFFNHFWFIPGVKELQALMDHIDQINQTAKMINVDPLLKGNYWGSKKVDQRTRLGISLSLERELELDLDDVAYLRPFLRL